jgi:ElaB/YqjD/DUF883 family membrane-anchored ribosome-binding protein
MADRIDDVRVGDDPTIRGTERERLAGSTGRDADRDADVEVVTIRAEIAETRDRLGDTIEEIGERLNPRNIKEQVKQNVRDATIGRVENMAHSAVDRVNDTRRTITDTIKQNPIPAAMVGVGLGWLMYNSRQASQGASRRTYVSEYERAYGRGAGTGTGYGVPGAYGSSGYAGGAYTTRAEAELEANASGAVGRVKEKAGEVGGTVKEKAGELADRAQETVSQVADRAQDLAGNVAEQTRYQARRVEDQFYENPLAIGAAALALGVAAGLAVPATRKEAELMGGARDQLVDRVREVASETKDKVQHVAERVVDEAQTVAKDAAREEGLTS